MSSKRRKPSTDPRKLGGTIAGPGGPRDKDAVVIDTTNAVLLDHATVAMVEPQRDGLPGPPVIALTLNGRVNHSRDWAEVLYLFDEDGAAAIITELLGLATRMGPDVFEHVMDRIEKLKDEDAIGTVG